MKDYLYKELSMAPDSPITRLTKFIYFLILFSVISVVLETEPLIADGKEHIFLKLNYAFGSIFFN